MTQGDFTEIRNLLITEYDANPQEEDWYAEEDRIRILIADDDEETRESLQKLLAFQPDFEVIGLVSNGREAVESATEYRPDVIIMDDAMPEMDGFEATKSITSKTNIDVIIISESTDAKIIQQGMLSGARFYLTKPVKDTQLIFTVRNSQQREFIRT